MPAGDGSGPRGEGPMTGRAMGRCTGYPAGGYETAPGRGAWNRFDGFGRRGGGRGWRNRFYETGLPLWRRNQQNISTGFSGLSETDSLRRRVEIVADVIEEIAGRINQLLGQRTGKGSS